ncbi:MAG: RagB/SusD family nutrient uptake outer membrane protein [Bacteroidota bacterium]|nr:RagB/SusD family nutrient uptake outer membrane protein [Candidatus Kapabacteria bacterium]MDW8219314.1 RagB/SusD family nutrient uptake outer membrane protein [Bacteroidota bacterium]
MNRRTSISCTVAAVVLVLTIVVNGCSLDYINPNAPAENQVLTTREGVIALAIGMQQFFATSTIEAYITTSGTSARELAVVSTFQDPLDLEVGGAELPAENSRVLAIWQRSYRTIGMAENLINSAPNVPLSAATRGGIIALASLYKAMCLGHLAMYFEQAPISLGRVGQPAQFRPRADVLAEAIRLLETAAQQVPTGTAAQEFTTQVLARGMNLANTIQAMRARFLNMAGRHAEAIAAANQVVTGTAGVSVFTYDAQQNRNPVFVNVILAGAVFAPRDNFGVSTGFVDTADARIRFFMSPNAGVGNTSRLPIETLVAPFFATPDAAMPVFRMGEMALIRAEAHARQNNLTAAVEEINRIRTKTRTQDPHGIGAGLPPYSGAMTQQAILNEIYAQRCAELFLTGQRFEDARRFGRPLPPTPTPTMLPARYASERNRNFYPYPALERDNNPNTPQNPPI